MKFSSVIQVPNTKNGILLKGLARLERTLAKATGYNIKIIEKSGTQLSRIFDRVFGPLNCHSEKCCVCKEGTEGKNTRCRITNVVYKAECILCSKQSEDKHSNKCNVRPKGVYISETSRILFQRSSEHVSGVITVMSRISS